jgi:2-keto-4-pentenoate hydratase/2-oxohepta-3-ene-1,7-dioic acid hydratase in catechol pathway
MNQRRRTFLTTSVFGTAVAAAGGLHRNLGPSEAAAATSTEPLPRGLTFVTIRTNGQSSLGIRTDKGIVDVRAAEAAFKLRAPTTIDAVLHGRGDLKALLRLVERAAGRPGLVLAEDTVTFGPCVTSPEKIICVGLNYRKHAAETGNPVPKTPILFNKYNNALAGHRGVIRISEEPTERVDYEVELVIVMGRIARNVSEADALSHVFGYCMGNDLSARDLQARTSQWMIGKSLDGFAPIGPYLVTADQVPDPNALALDTKVNGEVRQSSDTSDMVFNCRELIAYASKMFTLRPGDLIFTGTPEGVIAGYPKDKQVWLKPGDRLTHRIDKLGELAFTLG